MAVGLEPRSLAPESELPVVTIIKLFPGNFHQLSRQLPRWRIVIIFNKLSHSQEETACGVNKAEVKHEYHQPNSVAS